MRTPSRLSSSIAFLLLFGLALPLAPPSEAQPAPRARNVILFISDGAGPAVFTMARDYQRDYLRAGERLALDQILVGAVRTYSADSRTTDSAAGATAFSTGHKTYNGAVAVDADRRPRPTVLEAAEARGMATGLVATSSVTHATPAAFSAHVPDRGMQLEIAAQQMGKGIDVIFGGGRRYYTPAEQDGAREDGRDLLAEMKDAGYTVALSRADFAKVEQTPAVALFAADHMAYEIDRDTLAQPSLAEMTWKAIDLLSSNPEGFLLVVEGSRIDHAAHGNDVAGTLHDALAYDRAVRVALDFARADRETLVISVSDHETGGLSLGRADGANYAWQPEVVARVSASAGRIQSALRRGDRAPEAVLADYTGITDLSAEEADRLNRAVGGEGRLDQVLSDLIGRRASIGWTTGGHSAVDVNLYAFGPGSERLRGNHENTVVARVVTEVLGLDLGRVALPK